MPPAGRTDAQGSPAARTAASPSATSSAIRSTPITNPAGPTSRASSTVVQPDPEPTSSTRIPGRTRSARSIARTVVGWLLVCP